MIIKTNPEEFQNYLVDASNFKGRCDAVYFPESREDVIEILKYANLNKTTVTAAGNGTGLTGARVPLSGIVIATDKLNRILEINPGKKYAVVQPAVLLSDFQKEIKKINLFYPPDPTEASCFIGGTVATNASGAKTFKYGPTRDYVIELEVILPDGELLQLKRGEVFADNFILNIQSESGKNYFLTVPDYKMPEIKNASGYFCKKDMDAIDLFIGSEGTLGIITKIKLRLLDAPQEFISSVLFFDDENSSLNFLEKARDISHQNKNDKTIGVNAAALEYFDDRALKFLAKDFSNIPVTAKAAIWFEQEITSEYQEIIWTEWTKLIEEFNVDEEKAWFAFSDNDKEKIKEFRHAISWKVNEFVTRNNFRKLGTDVAVPDKSFREFYFTLQGWAKQSKIDFVSYGHFGNSHIHLNLLPKTEAEFNEGKNLYRKICEEAIRLGGTISAEHGIGKAKRDYLLMMYGEVNIRKMAALKKALDPNLILGIGNIFSAVFL